MALYRGAPCPRIAIALFLLGGGIGNLAGQVLTLQDGTPVRLRLMQTVSSADAHQGQTVDFEVSEPVLVQGLVVVPKDSVALGRITKVEPKRRFGRTGELEVSIESVRMTDGSRATLRANQEKGTGPIGGGRLAATIAGSPVLLWVKGKDVVFQKGMEVTAFINTDARLDEDQLRRQVTASTGPAVNGVSPGISADRIASPNKSITNSDLIEMRKVGLSDDVILTKIRTTGGDFRTGPQDLIQLKEAGVSDAIIREIVQQSGQR